MKKVRKTSDLVYHNHSTVSKNKHAYGPAGKPHGYKLSLSFSERAANSSRDRVSPLTAAGSPISSRIPFTVSLDTGIRVPADGQPVDDAVGQRLPALVEGGADRGEQPLFIRIDRRLLRMPSGKGPYCPRRGAV
jgi:hypothetical protein